MIGADLVAHALKAHGVTFISALVGNGINPVLFSARQAGIKVVDTRNEQTASFMAESYGRFTCRVGVCAVSSGGGHTNALSGLVNAHLGNAPMLLISGCSDHNLTDRGKFQDFVDQVAMAAPVTKYARLVDRPEKIPFYIHEALAHSVAGTPGPVHLTIPEDVLDADVSNDLITPISAATNAIVEQRCVGDSRLIEEAASAIAAAERPLMVAGNGVFYAHGEDALAEFAAIADIPVVVPIWDRGSIPNPIPQFMGVIGSASGSPDILQDADLVLILGAQVDYRLGFLQPPAVRADAKVIRVDIDPLRLRQATDPHIAILGDPRSVLEQLSARLQGVSMPAHADWLEEARNRDMDFRERWRGSAIRWDAPANGLALVEAIRPFVQGDAIFLVDGGNIGQWMHMVLCDRYPGHWMTCGASGVVGYGLGAAMAARIAYPSRPVILLSGDGSMGFNIADLESAVRQKLPFVAVVADDRAWGITVSNQLVQYGSENMVGCTLGAIRFDLAAEAFGAIGVRVENPREIGAAIERALAADRPTLIQVPVLHGGPADSQTLSASVECC
ncbi:MAG: thiamine pyrophosphate-binding protein [Chloroflexota bacterium]|jgi:acetolactate synthase-1/2/3 large subunit